MERTKQIQTNQDVNMPGKSVWQTSRRDASAIVCHLLNLGHGISNHNTFQIIYFNQNWKLFLTAEAAGVNQAHPLLCK